MRSVQGQLKAFKAEMERDGKAQQSECKKVIAIATKRAQNLVDSTLQVSQASVLGFCNLFAQKHSHTIPHTCLCKAHVSSSSVLHTIRLLPLPFASSNICCCKQQSNSA